MSYYCPNCKMVIETEKCPSCGTWRTRDPENGDLCLAVTLDYVNATIFADLLKQNGIPFMTQSGGIKGCGLTMGPRMFYVTYDRLEEARAVAEEFSDAPEEDKEEHSSGLNDPEAFDDADLYRLQDMSRDELTEYRKKLKETLRELNEREEKIRDAIDEIDYLLELEE